LPDSYASQERNVYKLFENENQQEMALPNNPMQLLDQLRRSSAMDDATNPSDALDEAIRIFNDDEIINIPVE